MKALSSTASATRHAFGALSEALIIAAIIGALVFGYAVVSGASPLGANDTFAARGGNGNGPGGGGGGTSGSITVLDGIFGGTTTATVNPGGEGTRVHTICFNDGGTAMESYVGVDANNQATITLGPTPSWSSGPATCVAEEGYWSNTRWRAVAETSFFVSGN